MHKIDADLVPRVADYLDHRSLGRFSSCCRLFYAEARDKTVRAKFVTMRFLWMIQNTFPTRTSIPHGIVNTKIRDFYIHRDWLLITTSDHHLHVYDHTQIPVRQVRVIPGWLLAFQEAHLLCASVLTHDLLLINLETENDITLSNAWFFELPPRFITENRIMTQSERRQVSIFDQATGALQVQYDIRNNFQHFASWQNRVLTAEADTILSYGPDMTSVEITCHDWAVAGMAVVNDHLVSIGVAEQRLRVTNLNTHSFTNIQLITDGLCSRNRIAYVGSFTLLSDNRVLVATRSHRTISTEQRLTELTVLNHHSSTIRHISNNLPSDSFTFGSRIEVLADHSIDRWEGLVTNLRTGRQTRILRSLEPGGKVDADPRSFRLFTKENNELFVLQYPKKAAKLTCIQKVKRVAIRILPDWFRAHIARAYRMATRSKTATLVTIIGLAIGYQQAH